MKKFPISFSAYAYLSTGLLVITFLFVGWCLRPEPSDVSLISKNVVEFSQVPADRFPQIGPRVATDLRGDRRFPKTCKVAEKAVQAFDRRATGSKEGFDSFRSQLVPTFLAELEELRGEEEKSSSIHSFFLLIVCGAILFGISILAFYRERKATHLIVEMIRGLKTAHLLGETRFTTLFGAIRRTKIQIGQLDDAYMAKDRDLTWYIRLAASERDRYEKVNRGLSEFVENRHELGEIPQVAEFINEVRMRTTGEMTAVTLDSADLPAVLQMPVDTEVDQRFPYLSRCHIVAGLLTPFRYQVSIPSLDNLLGIYDSTDVIKVILDRVCQALFNLGFEEKQLSYADHHLRIVMREKADMSDSEARSIENRILNYIKTEISSPLMFRGSPISMPVIKVEISEDSRRYMEMI